MNFHSIGDKKLFLLEINRADLLPVVSESWVPPAELIELFIQGRQSLVPKLKSFRRSQAAKAAWRRHRPGFLKGIRAFHRSTAGKRFHRTLGRWLATRFQDEPGLAKGSMLSLQGESLDQRVDLLRAVSSISNYSFAELGYYRSLYEELDYWEFLEELFPLVSSIEKKLFLGEKGLTEKEVDVLIRVVEDDELVGAVVEATGKTKDQIWGELKKLREGDEGLEVGWGQVMLRRLLFMEGDR